MRKIVRTIVITAVILIAGYLVTSVVIYQKIVNEGSVLADNQCLKVNPIIIERKNAYLKSMQALKDNDTADYEKETENYFSASRKYVTEQTKWLNEQKRYMDKWDFQYFNPSYVKMAAQYQWDSRKADTESTTLLIEAFDVAQLNQSLSEELGGKAVLEIKKRNEADKKYDQLWDNPGKLDWRTRFIRVPESKCPDENFNFPDVDEFLNPSIPANPDEPLS